MTEKGLSEKWAKNTVWCIHRLLMNEDILSPKKEDTESIALRILRSDYSKSHKRNILKALEHYMEFIGKPIKFKKPTKGKRLPRYLTQDELWELVRSARNYREFALLTLH